MDEHLIIEFITEEDANYGVSIINQIAAAWWNSQGYTVIGNELIPKNAITGEDDFSAQRTTTWDTVKTSPDGTYYFASPTSDPRFYLWRDYLPEGVSMPQDTIMPIEWTQRA